MDLHRYRFVSVWDVAAPATVVYQALRRTEDYPSWWPEVREVLMWHGRRGLGAYLAGFPAGGAEVAGPPPRSTG